MSDVRLAWGAAPSVIIKALGEEPIRSLYPELRGTKKKLQRLQKPALLASFYYLKTFIKEEPKYCIRDWVMDSGAFSAYNSGAEIDLDEYIETCLELLNNGGRLTEVFSLDVIGDYKASMKNTEKMWDAGVPAIPVYHYGEPESVLTDMAAEFPKISIGGCVGISAKKKIHFAKRCFELTWPCKIHGLGFCSEKHLMQVPFHSVDATNWQGSPLRFGNWKSFGQMSWRGSKQNILAEVEWHLNLERRLKTRWKREMKLLEEL